MQGSSQFADLASASPNPPPPGAQYIESKNSKNRHSKRRAPRLASKPMDYSVIIPAHDEEHFLPTTLDALAAAMAQCSDEGEIIVVDNNSTDQTAQVATEFGARVVFEPHRQIARARNAGAEQARGRWLIFVDADTTISPNLLQRALRSLASGSVCVGGSLLELKSPNRPSKPHPLTRLWNRVSLRYSLAAGCFLFTLAEAHRQVGGFDESYYASEEIWYVRALKRWGKRRHMTALIIKDERVVSSDRKLQMYNSWELFGFVLLSACPFALRNRRLCALWYGSRPKPRIRG